MEVITLNYMTLLGYKNHILVKGKNKMNDKIYNKMFSLLNVSNSSKSEEFKLKDIE